MLDAFTPAARRAIDRAGAWTRGRGSLLVGPADLLAALAEDIEGRAAAILLEHGAELGRIAPLLGLDEGPAADPGEGDEPTAFAAELRLLFADAATIARAYDRTQETGTEHLLAALIQGDGPFRERLAGAGLRVDEVDRRFRSEEVAQDSPIPLAVDLGALELTEPGETADLGRILDASGNRAREGLRVVEDYVRFALNDPGLTRRLKDIRHRFTEALGGLDPGWLGASRDTPGDVGTHIMTAAEQRRENPRAVLLANFKRVGEALRSLEEFAKLVDVWVSGRFEILRYDVYVVEKLVLTALASRRTFGDARLYVLVGGLPTLGDLTWVVEEALAGGAQAIQLREKGMPDRTLLSWAREVRILTARAGARFVMNDRPDLAVLAGADAVHLGQDDVAVRDARRVIGPTMKIGVSTHGPEQLDAALLAGANYLGVGPVFASGTKDFDDFAGLGYVRKAAEATNLPWFAIGGITEENLDEVLEAGATRVAVSGAVVRAERPRLAAQRLRERLDAL